MGIYSHNIMAQPTRGVDPMLFYRWPNVVDVGPALIQQWLKSLYFLGCWPYHNIAVQQLFCKMICIDILGAVKDLWLDLPLLLWSRRLICPLRPLQSRITTIMRSDPLGSRIPFLTLCAVIFAMRRVSVSAHIALLLYFELLCMTIMSYLRWLIPANFRSREAPYY